MSKFEEALNPALSCPHCDHAIKGTAFKGFHGIKQCPSCHKKIKFKKPAFGDIVKAIWKSFLVFLVVIVIVAALCISVLGTNQIPMPILLPLLLGYLIFIQMPAMNKLSSFEKDE